MELIEIRFSEVARYARVAARDHVSVSDTRNTVWYRTPGHEAFCAIMRFGKTARIKGVYVHPEWRGLGIGAEMTDAAIKIADASGCHFISVLAWNPSFYESRGFQRPTGPAPGRPTLLTRNCLNATANRDH